MPDLVACPTCNYPASVSERFLLESTDGPVEHLKISCAGPDRHWFIMPSASLSPL